MKHKILFSLLMIGLIVSSCLKNEAEPKIRELVGNWTWTASCGGFTGVCSYPDKENYKSLTITNDKFMEKINGTITIDMSYEITDTRVGDANNPFEVKYELTLEDGTFFDMNVIKKKLMIGNSYIDYYERQ